MVSLSEDLFNELYSMRSKEVRVDDYLSFTSAKSSLGTPTLTSPNWNMGGISLCLYSPAASPTRWAEQECCECNMLYRKILIKITAESSRRSSKTGATGSSIEISEAFERLRFSGTAPVVTFAVRENNEENSFFNFIMILVDSLALVSI